MPHVRSEPTISAFGRWKTSHSIAQQLSLVRTYLLHNIYMKKVTKNAEAHGLEKVKDPVLGSCGGDDDGGNGDD